MTTTTKNLIGSAVLFGCALIADHVGAHLAAIFLVCCAANAQWHGTIPDGRRDDEDDEAWKV